MPSGQKIFKNHFSGVRILKTRRWRRDFSVRKTLKSSFGPLCFSRRWSFSSLNPSSLTAPPYEHDNRGLHMNTPSDSDPSKLAKQRLAEACQTLDTSARVVWTITICQTILLVILALALIDYWLLMP